MIRDHVLHFLFAMVHPWLLVHIDISVHTSHDVTETVYFVVTTVIDKIVHLQQIMLPARFPKSGRQQQCLVQ